MLRVRLQALQNVALDPITARWGAAGRRLFAAGAKNGVKGEFTIRARTRFFASRRHTRRHVLLPALQAPPPGLRRFRTRLGCLRPSPQWAPGVSLDAFLNLCAFCWVGLGGLCSFLATHLRRNGISRTCPSHSSLQPAARCSLRQWECGACSRWRSGLPARRGAACGRKRGLSRRAWQAAAAAASPRQRRRPP